MSLTKLPVAIVNQLTSRAFISTELIEIGLSTPLYLTTAPFDIKGLTTPTSAGAKTYIAQGSFLSFTGIKTVEKVRVNNITLTLNGANSFYVNMVLNDNYLHRPIRIYKYFMPQRLTPNSAGAWTHIPPVLIYEGVMTGAQINESEKESIITIVTNSEFYDFMRTNGRKTNKQSQQKHFPTDQGMNFSTANISDITWGKKLPK
jgi:hypothetical protein